MFFLDQSENLRWSRRGTKLHPHNFDLGHVQLDLTIFLTNLKNLSWLSSEQPAPHNFNFGQVGLEAIFFYQPKHLSWSSASQLNLCNFNLGQVGLFGFSKIKKLHRLKSTTEKTKKKCWMKGYIQRLLLQKKSQGQWMRKEKKYIHF